MDLELRDRDDHDDDRDQERKDHRNTCHNNTSLFSPKLQGDFGGSII